MARIPVVRHPRESGASPRRCPRSFAKPEVDVAGQRFAARLHPEAAGQAFQLSYALIHQLAIKENLNEPHCWTLIHVNNAW